MRELTGVEDKDGVEIRQGDILWIFDIAYPNRSFKKYRKVVVEDANLIDEYLKCHRIGDWFTNGIASVVGSIDKG